MNKKVMSGVVIGLVFLMGCGEQEKGSEDDISMQPSEDAVTYNCEGEDVKVDFDNDAEPKTATMYVAEQKMILINTEAVSGVKYSDGDVTFWTHQGEATLSIEGTEQSLNCVEEIVGEEDVIVDENGNIVTEGCETWFDGCNICQVGEVGMPMACTKMFCDPATMKPAKCMDEESIDKEKQDCDNAGGVWSEEYGSCFEDPATMAGEGER